MRNPIIFVILAVSAILTTLYGVDETRFVEQQLSLLSSRDSIPGCNDPYADNYDSTATYNDGSCSYEEDFASIYTFIGVIESSSYYISNFNQNWWEANESSNNYDGSLAALTTEQENLAVSTLAQEFSSDPLWIGGYLNSDGYHWPPVMEWVTGECLLYDDGWCEGQPDYSSEHVVTNWCEVGGWDDNNSDNQFKWILERNSDLEDPSPILALSNSDMDFGEIVLGVADTQNVSIFNLGIGYMEIEDIQSSGDDFTGFFQYSNELHSCDTLDLTVVFEPTSLGEQSHTMTIGSYYLGLTIQLNLTGTVVGPPDIEVDPLSIHADLMTGDSLTQIITITNSGVSDLEWSMLFESTNNVTRETSEWENDLEYIGEFEGHDYYISYERRTWTDAHEIVQNWGNGFYLATVSSQEENDFINSASNYHEAWIGFTDMNNEGEWEWSNGEPVVYTNWAGGEPNDAGGQEDWAHLWNNGTWNDHTQYFEAYFIVESGSPSWLHADVVSGLIPPGDAQDIQVLFDAREMLFGGDYSANIIIENNDPEDSEVLVSTTLSVTALPEISVYPSPIEFGDSCYIDFSTPEFIDINNIGTGYLVITDIESNSSEFIIPEYVSNSLEDSIAIPPLSSYTFEIQFIPIAEGLHSSTITITSNATNDPILDVGVSGVGLEPPLIYVSPDYFTNNLTVGDSITETFTIENTGESVLNWSSSILVPSWGIVNALDSSLIEGSSPMYELEDDKNFIEYGSSESNSSNRSIQSFDLSIGDLVFSAATDTNANITDLYSFTPAGDFSMLIEGIRDVLAVYENGSIIFLEFQEHYSGHSFHLKRMDPDGTVSHIATFNNYGGDYDLDSYGNIVYITNNDLFLVSPYGNVQAIAWGIFQDADAVAVHPKTGDIYVADRAAGRIVRITMRADDSHEVQYLYEDPNRLVWMEGLDFTPDGTLIIADEGTNSIYSFNGHSLTTVSQGGLIDHPEDVVVDSQGNYLVSMDSYDGANDSTKCSIVKITPEGDQTYLIEREFIYIDDIGIYRDMPTPWVSTNITSGTVAPGSQQIVEVYFNASDIIGGYRRNHISINSNAPNNSSLHIQVNAEVTGIPHISAENQSVSLGDAYIGYPSFGHITIFSSGTDVLEVFDVQSNNNNVTIDDTYFLVPALEFHTFAVQFTPTTIGAQSATLTLTSNDPDTPSLNINVSYIGVGFPTISFDPDSLHADLEVDSTTQQALTISNEGLSNLDWNIAGFAKSIAFTKEDYADWTLPENQDRITDNVWITRCDQYPLFNAFSQDCDNSQGPDGTEWAIGSVTNEWLHFTSFRNALGQVGNEMHHYLIPDTIPMVLHLIEDDLYFEIQFHSWTSGQNEGGGGFSYTRSEEPAEWLGTNEVSGTIPPGGSQDLDVLFDANNVFGGEYSTEIMFNTNVPEMNLVGVPVTLSVNGISEIYVDTSYVRDFGEVFMGGESTIDLWIENNGNDDLIISDIQINSDSSDAAPISVSSNSFTVSPEENYELEVTFSPVSVGEWNYTLSIMSNDPDDSVVVVDMYGSGTLAPDIAVTPTSFSVTELSVGDSTVRSMSITNEGDNTLEWRISGAPSGNRSTEDFNEFGDDMEYLGMFGGNEYWLSNYGMHWTEANEYLNSFQNIHLVTITSESENDFLIDVFNSDEHYWIGFTDEVEEGNWKWVTGEEVTYTNWSPNNPDNWNNVQHYGLSNWGEPGLWDDASYDQGFRFIAEVEGVSGNYSLFFDGDDAVTINAEIIPTSGNYTVQSWAKSHGNIGNGFNHITAQHENYYVGTNSESIIRVGDYWQNTEIEFPFFEWNNITVVKTSSYANLYMNGYLVSVYDGELPNPPGGEFIIGAQYGGLGEGWYGFIDEVRVFDVALSENEIQNNLYKELNGNEEGLIGYWNFNEADGDIVYDLSGNENHGTINGALWGFSGPFGNSQITEWLEFPLPSSGLLEIGESIDIDLIFNAENIYGGDYNVDFLVLSNDPDESAVVITASLEAIGIPEISVDESVIDFGELFIGKQDSIDLIIASVGTDHLNITNIESDGDDFTLSNVEFSIAPENVDSARVYFSPTSSGEQSRTITIISDDPDSPSIEVNVTGTGVEPPDIVVNPEMIVADIYLGDDNTQTQTLSISNEGPSELEYFTSIEGYSGSSAKVLPLSLGNYWRYLDVDDEEEDDEPWVETDSIFIIKEYEGEEYYCFDTHIDTAEDGHIYESWVGWKGSTNDAVWGIYNSDMYEDQEWLLELTLMKANPYVGQSWTSDWFEGEITFTITENLDYSSSLGDFTDCWLVDISFGEIGEDGPDENESWIWKIGLGPLERDNHVLIEYGLNVDWLTMNPSFGTVSAGSTQDIEVNFNADGMFSGQYATDIVIHSNDPDESKIIVPATLAVTGVPEIGIIYLEDPSFDIGGEFFFGELYIESSVSKDFIIENNGSGDLVITNMQVDGDDWSLSSSSLTILPGQHDTLTVLFNPGSIGEQNKSLTITSNDSESPLILSLVGYCVDPPHLVIDILDGDQDTIDVNIPLGEAFDDHMLAIKNDGGSNLWVKMHIEEEGTLGSVFPLVIGNWWEFMYSEENDEGNIEVEYESDQILNTAEYNGELYYVVETFSNGWFGLKSGQDAIVANYNTEDGLSERKLLSYEPFVGETWTEDGLTITVVEKLDYTTEYLGTIKDCWKVEMVTNDMYGLIDESVEIWYWKIGIGRIAIESDKGNAELKNFQLRSNTDWVGTDETHNEISPSELNNIHMYFNQDTLGTGTKTASLVLFSNDPDNERMNIPIKMTLDDKPHPRVLSVSPSPGFIDHRTKEITINMSAPIGNYTDNSLTYDFATAGNAFIDAYISYIDSSNSFKITFDNGLSAADIFSFSLQNIESIYGYSLDGNGDGQGGDNYSSDNYVTSMLGDFNVDSTISVEDLSQFVIGLDTDNHDYELGPYNGELPYVSLSTDSKYDIEDIVAFSMMWNWYYSNNTMTFNSFEDEGTPIIIDAEHDSIYIDLQEDLSAYQIQIQYIPGSFFIGASENNVDLFLTHQEHELGIYTIMAEPEDSRLVIPIEIRGKNTEISISYKGLTKEGILAGKMTKSMNIANIPDEFVLFSNYPNPFNPSTKIDYGIPEAVNVQLVVYDLLGREVITLVNGFQEPGYRSVDWHGTDSYGRNVGAGMYFFLIQAGEFRESHKMLLLK